jgi:hypothetical protein
VPPGAPLAWPGEPDEGDRLPTTFALRHPVPNPFNPVTTVKSEAPSPGSRVSIVVYNVRGQRVADLVDRRLPAGYHRVQWDGVNRSGNAVASGLHFIHMRATGFVRTVKAVVLK